MSAFRGVLTGSLSLIALQALVSSNQSAGRVGTAATSLAAVISHIVSPAVPLIPDRRASAKGTTAGSSSTTSGSGTAALPGSQFSPATPLPRPATNPAPVIAPPVKST